jgi:hypothetical protein
MIVLTGGTIDGGAYYPDMEVTYITEWDIVIWRGEDMKRLRHHMDRLID